jgi:dedicator of cytokinesis protein 3
MLTCFSSRLSEILKHQATLLDSICNDVRYYPDYFRVTFFGSNFPAAVRNKSIVVSVESSYVGTSA